MASPSKLGGIGQTIVRPARFGSSPSWPALPQGESGMRPAYRSRHLGRQAERATGGSYKGRPKTFGVGSSGLPIRPYFVMNSVWCALASQGFSTVPQTSQCASAGSRRQPGVPISSTSYSAPHLQMRCSILQTCAYGGPVQASHPATIKLTHYPRLCLACRRDCYHFATQLLNIGQDRAVSDDQRPTPKPNKISHIDIR